MQFKIMNVLLTDTGQFVDVPSLLCRSSAAWVPNSQNGTCAFKAGTHDFMTYFNALSVEKWRRYTVSKSFGLHLEVKGSCQIVQTRADAFSRQAVELSDTQIECSASGEWQEFDMSLVEAPGDVCLSFLITSNEGFELKNCYYYAEVAEDAVRPVELSLCTTTFKKEEYIQRNINLVKNEILASADPVANHFYMHVMDNGRTLDVDALSADAVFIHPTNNVGGAGGFARGMIESMEQTPKATHVLLMDDDVLISTESIKRTYALLSLVNDEYKDAFVGGAMMNLEEPTMLFEDLAYMKAAGYCSKMKDPMHVHVMHNVVANESFNIPLEYPDCQDQTQQYAAWWYCAIPMSQIEKNGLPLPIFVRMDDVEYGLRCKPKFIHLNGICVWHQPFFLRYSGAQECYQGPRNSLINKYTTDFAPMSDILAAIKEMFWARIVRFSYADTELLLRGLEDFLKGPEWLATQEAKDAFVAMSKQNEKYIPFSELKDELLELGVNPLELTDWKIYRNAIVEDDYKTRFSNKFFYKSTFNGQTGNVAFTTPGKVGVIDAFNFAGGESRFMHAETIVAVDIPNGAAAIRKIDRKRFSDIYSRYTALMSEIEKRDAELHQLYAGARTELTSVAYWKKYLQI